ncbi:UDP-N-acetylmuramoyl-tripeptide--D-alanyl-D-alanine ligase [Corynebacterium kutscheri]|uniref:UDP-N-acetylmuramoyl-tripeptide--D-alanyl-D-alanine ligase n=1 Tax=Corynebacterium kutscheri TaxID=35755 RepID=A0AB38VZD5_9CORY|nr:UDP-N-acetylmuramoyl-tripeptide--D-alanyl-D-alanine ligase [Corynebacterium kutscheri]VEH08843.1 UDP-N-acetylmuramoylalanyl-D-glutamyl-2, 6-diamino pimelate-D-alanyl-D-alanyl ligase [Corynebacterium kutscheri]
MIPMTLGHIAAVTGGEVVPAHAADKYVTAGVEFDSRRVEPDGLFVAIAGNRVDGHDFAASTPAAGTLAFKDVGAPCVVVPKTQLVDSENSYLTAGDNSGAVASVVYALGLLARYVVDELKSTGLRVIGVTGSAGKTSTKDMMASVFAAAGETIAPPGSMNNEIGHPYTALKCTRDTQFLVAEMSARGIGHVAHLAEIAPPEIAVVLNVGSAHLSEFGSREIIAQAKAELVEALPPQGVAVLNADDEYVRAMSSRTSAQVLSFSTQQDNPYGAEITAKNIVLDSRARASFTVHYGAQEAKICLQVAGLHQVSNALAAVGAGLAAGLKLENIAPALSSYQIVSAHRMDTHELSTGAIIIDDAYNANMESMTAGFHALRDMTSTGKTSWAVLGPMAEAGINEIHEHEILIDRLVDTGINHLIVVGNHDNAMAMYRQAQKLKITVHKVADAMTATAILRPMMQSGDAVLVKASNSYKLWEVATQLIEADELENGTQSTTEQKVNKS